MYLECLIIIYVTFIENAVVINITSIENAMGNRQLNSETIYIYFSGIEVDVFLYFISYREK